MVASRVCRCIIRDIEKARHKGGLFLCNIVPEVRIG